MRRLIVTFGGLGLIPGMPGTYASLATAAIFYLLWAFYGPWGCAVSGGLLCLSCVAGYALAPWAERNFARKDPGQFVLDEVAGQLLTLIIVFVIGLAFAPFIVRPLAHVAAGFLIFRAFDVSKPFPIREIEKLRGGHGIMLDDLLGAVYAAGGLSVMILVVRAIVGAELYDKVK